MIKYADFRNQMNVYQLSDILVIIMQYIGNVTFVFRNVCL